jgi:hypothetical protein
VPAYKVRGEIEVLRDVASQGDLTQPEAAEAACRQARWREVSLQLSERLKTVLREVPSTLCCISPLESRRSFPALHLAHSVRHFLHQAKALARFSRGGVILGGGTQ